MSPGLEIQLIAIIIAIACALVGVFLVLRKMAMVSDAITHTILLGIVLGFFITKDINSPMLIIGATLMGVVTVWLTEMLKQTHLVSEDAAIGLVFPFLFSIAIILLTRYAGQTHLCIDSVLLGEITFAPFNRLYVGGRDVGAKAIYTGGLLLIVNVTAISLMYKELKITTFDPILASIIGITPTVFYYLIMILVSLTAVVSFEAVGSILVIAFMIGPSITAYFLTKDLKKMILLAAFFGSMTAIMGYYLAVALDVSIAGSMAVVMGIIFCGVLIFAPKQGIVNSCIQRSRQKKAFSQATLLVHLYNHQGACDEKEENGIHTIQHHLHWKPEKMNKLLKELIQDKRIEIQQEVIVLTQKGIEDTELIAHTLLSIE